MDRFPIDPSAPVVVQQWPVPKYHITSDPIGRAAFPQTTPEDDKEW